MQKTKAAILLPKWDRNKRPIEGAKFSQTYDEIYEQFGGCTIDFSPLLGSWFNKKTQKRDEDRLISYWVVYDDNYSNMYFLDEMKEKLKQWFGQDEIFMYSYLINVF